MMLSYNTTTRSAASIDNLLVLDMNNRTLGFFTRNTNDGHGLFTHAIATTVFSRSDEPTITVSYNVHARVYVNEKSAPPTPDQISSSILHA